DVGSLAMPLLLGLRWIRWLTDGTVEVGSPAARAPRPSPNLAFDRSRLLLEMRVLGRDVLATLDTGANTTDLNANFADTFPEAIRGAKKGTTDITGVGGTQTFDSFEVTDVVFGIGGRNV